MDDTTYEITIGNDPAEPIMLAVGTSREDAEAEASHYRHNVYVGKRIRLWSVTRTVIEDGTAIKKPV